jgi:hypothetical protein
MRSALLSPSPHPLSHSLTHSLYLSYTSFYCLLLLLLLLLERSALSFTASLLIGCTSAGCPFSHLHESGEGVTNPHVAANQHSLKVNKTPLVHFKIPPKDRSHAAGVVMEGGVLVEKKSKNAKKESAVKDDNNNNNKANNGGRSLQDSMITGSSSSSDPSYSNQNIGDGYAIPEGGYDAVRKDVIDMVLTNSQAFWPADFNPPVGPNYSGLLIRLAWHCNGTYRISDGRGGCDGGLIRFPPVSEWADNASLNMVRYIACTRMQQLN